MMLPCDSVALSATEQLAEGDARLSQFAMADQSTAGAFSGAAFSEAAARAILDRDRINELHGAR
jgi:hypothetical protein